MYNRKIRLEKVLNTTKDKHGNKIETGIVKGGEYTTEEGYTIKGGKYIAFQITNKKAVMTSRTIRFNRDILKLLGRHEALHSMGVAATYNRLRAPLQGHVER